jgi:hypothetical protein
MLCFFYKKVVRTLDYLKKETIFVIEFVAV